MIPAKVRIQTGARLHFGLLDVVPPFGGLGMMVDAPETVVSFTASETFSVDDALAARATPIAQRVRSHFQLPSLPCVRVKLHRAAPAHSGFGSGTQLSMAIAEGLCRCIAPELTDGAEPLSAETLPAALLPAASQTLVQELSDRGKRSAVGVHGYFAGGLIYEEAKCDSGGINQVIKRVDLNDAWRVALIRPLELEQSVAGAEENHRFSKRESAGALKQEELRRMITDQILPAAEQGDFDSFADAIQTYNQASGMLFASVQEGAYNGPVVTRLIQHLKKLGITGVGQSSWGPGVFAWCESETRANHLQQELSSESVEVQITRPRASGREVYFSSPDRSGLDSGH